MVAWEWKALVEQCAQKLGKKAGIVKGYVSEKNLQLQLDALGTQTAARVLQLSRPLSFSLKKQLRKDNIERWSVLLSQSRTRGHTTKIILWGSHSSIVISRRHTGEATTNTTSQTSTLVGANLCLLIPKPKSLATATFHNAPFDSSKQRRPKELSMWAKHRERGGSSGA